MTLKAGKMRWIMLILCPLVLVMMLGAAPAWTQTDAGASAQSPAARLTPLLLTPRLMEALAAEGRAQGADLGADMLEGAALSRWTALVEALHEPARLQARFDAALDRALSGREAMLDAIEGWFSEDLGARIAQLEIEARLALIDPYAVDAAALAYETLKDQRGPRLALLQRFVDVNGLIEANVAGGMNANFAFMQGMAEGAGLSVPEDEGALLADLWSQQEEIRRETEDWLLPYLTLAYQPLGDADLEAYIDFAASAPGQALNTALLAAYEDLFTAVARELGHAAGRMSVGSDL